MCMYLSGCTTVRPCLLYTSYPYRYTDWYLPLIDAGKSMPDAIGEDAPEGVAPTEGAPLTPTDAMASGGDGIVTEEQVRCV